MNKILITLLLISLASQTNAQPVKRFGQLQVKGTQLCDSAGNPVILRGMSFGWHNLWPRFYNAGAVQTLANDWSCTVVRAAMGIELNSKGYLKDPEGSVASIRAVVDAAIKQGIYVIIDWHDHNLHQTEAGKFFSEMAMLYGKYPNVIYELFNEPDYETWPEVKAYSEAIIRSIRKVDPDNIILVGCPRWDQDIQLPAADPITDQHNLMYTVHFYAATHKQWLRDRTDKAIADGLPIFVSESAGMEATGDGPLNLEEWDRWITWMESRKISWITWSVSDKDETCSVLQKSAASEGGWEEKDLKQSGTVIKKKLRQLSLKK
ncbi:MAG: glycoside hydrolase family 5 protein [Flavitalea sp.]